jgi:hypothetical protein
VKDNLTQHNRQYNNPLTQYPNSPSSSAAKNNIPYKFDILISFYEKKEIKEWIGLLTRIENAYFEHWRIPVTIIDFPFSNNNLFQSSTALEPSNSANNATNDFNSQYRKAYDCVSSSIMMIIEVNTTKS